MLKLPILEFFIRGIPEAFLLVFAIYAFSRKKIEIQRYLITAVLTAITTFSVRLLPIHYGVHTIISSIVIILLTIFINKIDIIKAIKATIVSMILEFICEGINVFIVQFILRIDINTTFKNPILKTLYGIPSLLILGIISFVYYNSFLKQKGDK